MAFWNKFPYTDFHELNLDWILQKIGLVDQAKLEAEAAQAAAEQAKADAISAKNSASVSAGSAAASEQAAEDAADRTQDLYDNIGGTVAPQVTAWLNENVDPVGSAVVVDESLSIAGAAADAAATRSYLSETINLVPPKLRNSGTANGVTLTVNANGTYTLSGTCTDGLRFDLISLPSSLPSWLDYNTTYYAMVYGRENAHVSIESLIDGTGTYLISNPETLTKFVTAANGGIRISVRCNAGVTYNETIKPMIFSDSQVVQGAYNGLVVLPKEEKLANDVINARNMLSDNNVNINLAYLSDVSKTQNGIDFTSKNGTVTIDGTSTGIEYIDIISLVNDSENFPFVAGKRYSIKFTETETPLVYKQIKYKLVGDSSYRTLYNGHPLENIIEFVYPENCIDWFMRIVVDTSGMTFNAKTIDIDIENRPNNGLNKFDESLLDGVKYGKILFNDYFLNINYVNSDYYGLEFICKKTEWTISGTATATGAFYLLEDYNHTYFKAGDRITVDFQNPENKVYIEIVTKNGTTTHSPLLQTTAGGTYSVTFPDEFDYVRINFLVFNGQEYSSNITLKVESASSETKTFIVAKNGTGDYTKLKDAIGEAVKYYNATVIVKSGTYDLVEEYGQTYLDSLSSGDYGMMLYNGINIKCSPNAHITFNYNGTNPWIIANFSPFNTGNDLGYTIDGMNCTARNCRYILHDDPRPEAKTKYSYNTVKNCYFEMYSSPGYADWINHQIIGGGLGDATSIVIENCIFNDNFTGVQSYNAVSYHNSTSGSSDYESKITIKDCYFMNGNKVAFEGYGDATSKTKVIVTNNNLQNGDADITYSSTAADNMTVYKWNNVSRA